MGKFVKVAKKSDIPEDSGLHVELGGREIALFKVDGKVYAIDNMCPHAGGPLAEGGLNGKKVMCPWHGWEFDVTDGACAFNKAITVSTIKVQEKGGDIYLET